MYQGKAWFEMQLECLWELAQLCLIRRLQVDVIVGGVIRVANNDVCLANQCMCAGRAECAFVYLYE